MDWFHCNQCFCRGGTAFSAFSVTSCGHILCGKCIKRDNCPICKAACKYLVLSDNIKPQEKMYFKGLKETAQRYFEQIGQVWSFQKHQNELLMTFYKKQLLGAQTTIQEAMAKITRQEKDLKFIKKENEELKLLVSSLKGLLSKAQCGNRSYTPRPIGVTSPTQTVTPRHSSQHSSQVVSRSSSLESIPYREPRSGGSSTGAGSRAQSRTASMLSMNTTPSPSSGRSLSYRVPGTSFRTPVLMDVSLGSTTIGQIENDARDHSQPMSVTNTPSIFTADLREESSRTPGGFRDRLMPIQLRLTPRGTFSYQSQTPSSLSRGTLD